jgi:hypothetical protein
MTTTDWAQFILALLSIGVVVVGAIRWYIQVQVKPIAEAVEDIRAETKTNGGSSMRDEIKFIKSQQEKDRQLSIEHKEKLDHMYDILLEYITRTKN